MKEWQGRGAVKCWQHVLAVIYFFNRFFVPAPFADFLSAAKTAFCMFLQMLLGNCS